MPIVVFVGLLHANFTISTADLQLYLFLNEFAAITVGAMGVGVGVEKIILPTSSIEWIIYLFIYLFIHLSIIYWVRDLRGKIIEGSIYILNSVRGLRG